MVLRRREFLATGLTAAGALAVGPAFFRSAAQPATPGPGPYGPLRAADANGVMLPEGFRSRVVARGLAPVSGTAYPWHIFSDGAATYRTPDGGWILVSNSEATAATGAGASAIRFRADGRIAGAYRILRGTNANCSGGATPWGTWLSCEETDTGRVWECDPTGGRAAVVRPAMGVFKHEAAAVDPDDKRVYLSEDLGDGGLYRFSPAVWPNLTSGLLEVALVASGGVVTWRAVPDPAATTVPTRRQVPGMTQFKRGEGLWWDAGIVYLATTSDQRIHALNTVTDRIEVIYDGKARTGQPLQSVDNLTISPSGDLFVCEDQGEDSEVGIITPDRVASPFMRLTAPLHSESELTGPVFDPSGTRFYVASQRAFGGVGAVLEVTGPFRRGRASKPSLSVRVAVPDSVTLRGLLRRGVPVRVKADRGVRVSLALRSGRTRRRRVGAAGRRQITLGRRTRSVAGAGTLRLRLRPGRRARRYLRLRRVRRLSVVISVVDSEGNKRRITEVVKIRMPRSRRRRS